MHARSALFDVFGDHVVRRGGWAPVAGLVRVLEALEIAPPATRTAISRMVREGWLAPLERDGVRGYAATSEAQRHLDEARRRIYGHPDEEWDGVWDVIVLDYRPGRASRDRIAAVLRYLGYAPLSGTTWVAPRRNPELAGRLAGHHVRWDGFGSSFDGDDRGLAARLWDLDGLAASYREFLAALEEGREATADGVTPREAFFLRSRLVHRWRLFLFDDPGLPPAVLPGDWPRPEASRRFAEAAHRLLAPADAFVDDCLGPPGGAGTREA